MSIVMSLSPDDIQVIKERYAYDPIVGVFTFKKSGRVVKVKRRYFGITLRTNDLRCFSASHIAWLLYYGESPPSLIYHSNRDHNDYRIVNLQLTVPDHMKSTKHGHQVSHKYRDVAIGAQRRNLIFALTQEQCEQLLLGNCHYCGVPSTEFRNRKDRSTAGINGIDRVDNTRGYVVDNVVSCCKTCNYAKGTLTLDEFKSWIRNVYHHTLA